MKISLLALAALFFVSSCSNAQSGSLKIPVASSAKPAPGEAVATFGQGCFWHTEIVFQSLEGVRDAVSGYAGGTAMNPSYEEVCGGGTGHAEVVNVYYDPAKISYAELVDAFFSSHDPTQVNRQGNDVGTQYRSVAFYRNQKEKEIITAAIAKLTASKKYSKKIATQVAPYQQFYAAEPYHQEYIFHHPGNGYVQNVSIPDFREWKSSYKARYKN